MHWARVIPAVDWPGAQPLWINLPLVATVALLAGLPWSANLPRFWRLGFRDGVVATLGVFLKTSTIAALATLVGSLAEAMFTQALAGLVWSLIITGSTAFTWDVFGFKWVGQHLQHTLPMLLEGMVANPRQMHSKIVALIWVVGAYAILLPTMVALLQFVCARHPELLLTSTLGRLFFLVLVGACLVIAEQFFSGQTMSASGYRLRSDVFWISSLLQLNPPVPPPGALVLNNPRFKGLPGEGPVDRLLAKIDPTAVRRPLTMFVFVIDSLRRDALTEAVAPCLSGFRARGFEPRLPLANSNCTHPSWFALVHGVNPLYWSVLAHQRCCLGAVPIRMLRRAGYRVHVLSATQMDYFGFARSSFGERNALADSVTDQRGLIGLAQTRNAGELDGLVMDRLIARMHSSAPGERSLYLCFLSATHYGYDYPPGHPAKFSPCFHESPMRFSSINHDNLALLRNRYFNAVNYVDGLFGRFFEALEQGGWTESSAVVVTSDHGEEFLEEGRLTHASALNSFQLQVPLIFGLPADQPPTIPMARPPAIGSHMDVFPTLLHLIGLEETASQVLRGRSLLSTNPPAYAICAACNSFTPQNFLIDSGDTKLAVHLEGASKVGTNLLARRLIAANLVDSAYHPLPHAASEPQCGILDTHPSFRTALSSLLAPGSLPG